MDRVIPWARWVALIEPHYPKAGLGRRPMPLERMLRIHLLQQWFNLSDPAMEEMLIDSQSMRRFAGINLMDDPVPDETTILKFRHLLEANALAEKLFRDVGMLLTARGLMLHKGTIVDATIINAPPSTKNRDRARHPDISQVKKRNTWQDRKSTRLNSSHTVISYAVFCLKKKRKQYKDKNNQTRKR